MAAALQHGLHLACVHEVVAAAEQHHAACRQVLGPQVEVGPEEAAAEGGAHVQLVAGHVHGRLLDKVHHAVVAGREGEETGMSDCFRSSMHATGMT